MSPPDTFNAERLTKFLHKFFASVVGNDYNFDFGGPASVHPGNKTVGGLFFGV